MSGISPTARPARQHGGAGASSPAQKALEEFTALIGRPVPLGAGHGDFPALVKRLWFECQRRRAVFDWLLDGRCKRLEPAVRHILWWALTECYALDGLPSAVAVDTAVSFARHRQGPRSAAFVNAVLRGVLRDFPDRAALAKAVAAGVPPAVQAGLPAALYERWRVVYGAAWTRETGALLQTEAPVTMRRRGCFRGPAHGRPYPAGGVFTMADGTADTDKFYLQDPSTILAPLLVSPAPGARVADLCAAPGGKSLILAEMLDGTGELLCCDRAPERLVPLQENLRGHANVTVKCADATRPALPPESFDAVLLDVPCSNTGVLRRRPDVRWNYSTAGLRELLALQRSILAASAPLVRPGGVLVYSTCSIEPEENLAQVQRFLQGHPDFTLECSRQLLPTVAHDGAYAARLRRLK